MPNSQRLNAVLYLQGMKFVREILPNGVTLITSSMPSLASTSIVVWAAVGSRFEERRINGISHFLEHMVFKGSKNRPSAKAISQAVDGFGGEFNASTGKEYTNFYIKARNEKLTEAYDVLADMVLNPTIPEEKIEQEKGTILEEMAMYEDTPLYKISDIFENLIYKGTSLGWDIIGNQKSVKTIERKDFMEFRKKHYLPQNIIVTIAGGADMKLAKSLTKKYFSSLKGKADKKVYKEKFVQKEPRSLVKYKKTDQTHVVLGFRGIEYGSKKRYTESVLTAILGGGMSSRLFTEVREKRGLCYAIKTRTDHAVDTGYIGTYAGLKTSKVKEAVKIILCEYEKISAGNGKITKAELKKAKEYIKGHIALSLENTTYVNYFAAQDEIYGENLRSPEEVYKKIDAVTVGEVIGLAREIFKREALNLAVIGPFKDESEFDKILVK